MCWQCEKRDGTVAEHLDEIHAAVRAHGWAVKYVEDDKRPYAYTIGLHELGLPELLATGVTTGRALALLDYFVEESITNGPLAPGHRIELSDTAAIEVVEIEHPDAHLGLEVALYGPDFRAVQLVWTDMSGRWPWDSAFAFDGMMQPVLGKRAPQKA